MFAFIVVILTIAIQSHSLSFSRNFRRIPSRTPRLIQSCRSIKMNIPQSRKNDLSKLDEVAKNHDIKLASKVDSNEYRLWFNINKECDFILNQSSDWIINQFYDPELKRFLFRNKLTFFPINTLLDLLLKNDEIKNNLIELDISNNVAMGIIDWDKINQFKNLKVFLALNNFIFSEQVEWTELMNLERIDLSFNPFIRGQLIWDDLPLSLLELNVYGTGIKSNIEWDKIQSTKLKKILFPVDNESIHILPDNWSVVFDFPDSNHLFIKRN